MTTLRLLSRLIGLVWALVLALVCLGLVLYSLDALIGLGKARPDKLLHLAGLESETGHLLKQLETPGHVASLSMLSGIAVVLIGLLLVLGLFTRRRDRLAPLKSDSSSGALAARPRALKQMARALSGETREVLSVRKVRLALKRRGAGGRLSVDVNPFPGTEKAAVESALENALAPLAEPFGLKRRVSVTAPRDEERR